MQREGKRVSYRASWTSLVENRPDSRKSDEIVDRQPNPKRTVHAKSGSSKGVFL